VRKACETLRARMAPVAANLIAAAWKDSAAKPVKVDIAPMTGVNVSAAKGGSDEILASEVIFADGHAFAQSHPEVKVPLAKVATQCYVERVSLSATGYYATPGIHWDWSKGAGRPFAYYAGGVAVSEVEVDGYTGMTRVRRVDIVHDVGDSLNPGIDRGQIEGGFVQGMGWLTSEELKWDAKGKLLTHSASTYQIPAISDAPMEFNVTLLPDATNANAVHGSKAVGEPPLMLAISVREAIRAAVASFAAKAGEPVLLASPATPEAVWRAVQARRNG
jgi:xanthine dehydrogenase molybdopterin-binding subunit B